jgi:endonuclease/exonuclease/phosphatase family metal-dependent hydrolase
VTTDILRVATWNVHGLRGGVAAVARTVRDEAIDVLLLQESGPRRRFRELGRELSWIGRADPRAFPQRRIQNAVLLHPRLVGRIYSMFIRFDDAPFLQPRGASIAVIRDRMTLVSTHLDLRPKRRLDQARQLRSALHDIDTPVVIGGDMNGHPSDPAVEALTERYEDAWRAAGEGEGFTMPAELPMARIDYLFVGPALRPLRAWTVASTASDHLMVVAEVELDR